MRSPHPGAPPLLLPTAGRARWAIARFPDGHICEACLIRSLRTRGTCPGCGTGQLISCGLLPAADKQLLDYEWWLHRHLAALDGTTQADIDAFWLTHGVHHPRPSARS